MVHDVRPVVADNTSTGVGVARGNVTRCAHDVTSQRAAAATANSRDELNTPNAFSTFRNSRDSAAKPPGKNAFLSIWFVCYKVFHT